MFFAYLPGFLLTGLTEVRVADLQLFFFFFFLCHPSVRSGSAKREARSVGHFSICWRTPKAEHIFNLPAASVPYGERLFNY
jgi:hypothetical protein